MRGHEGPGIGNQVSLLAQVGESIQKIISIDICPEYFGFLDAPAYYVMKSPGGIESRMSGHRFTLALLNPIVKVF